jgi:hypothetical protein
MRTLQMPRFSQYVSFLVVIFIRDLAEKMELVSAFMVANFILLVYFVTIAYEIYKVVKSAKEMKEEGEVLFQS